VQFRQYPQLKAVDASAEGCAGGIAIVCEQTLSLIVSGIALESGYAMQTRAWNSQSRAGLIRHREKLD
jgi:hypothetical protein